MFILNIYFSHKNKKILNKHIFWVKGTRQGLKPWSYVFSLKMRNQSYIVLYKTIWKWFGKPFNFYEVNLTRICPAPTYLHSQWRIKDHVVLDKTWLEYLIFKVVFWHFWKWVSCDACGRVDTKEHFLYFYIWKGVSCGTNDRLDTKIFPWFLYFKKRRTKKKKCRATRAVDWTPKHLDDFFIYLKRCVVRRKQSIRHQYYFMSFIFKKKYRTTRAVD